MMNKKEALDFLNGFYQTIWQRGEIDKIPEYYHQELQMTINGKILHYDDIKKKILAQHEKGIQLRYKIIDLATDDNLIAFQIAVESLYIEGNALEVAAFFHLHEGKIWKAWGLSRSLQ